MKFRAFFYNLRAVVACIGLIPVFIILAMPIIFLPASWRFRSRWYYGVGHRCTRILLWASGIRFRIEGKEKLEALVATPAVIVLNHQSCLDPFIIEMLFGSQPRVVFSNDYSKVPLLGAILRRMHVIVERVSVRSSNAALDKAVALARAYGNHVLIFPEGTRHADGRVHKFYRGFTVLAEQLGRPVVPIFFHGMHNIMPKGSSCMKPIKKPVFVCVGDPFVFDPASQTREEFLEKVHNWFTLESGRVNQNQ